MHSREPRSGASPDGFQLDASTSTSLIENSSDFIAICALDGRVTYVNRAGRDLLHVESLEAAQATRLTDYFQERDLAALHGEIMPALEREGRWIGDFRLRDFQTGAPVPVACNMFYLVDDRAVPTGIATVSRDRRRRDRLESGLRLLARTGAATLDALDVPATLANIARAFVDEFASYCIIDIYDRDGWRRTVVHRDPALEAMIEAVAEPSGEHPIARAVRAGETTVSAVDDRWLEAVSASGERIVAVRELGVRSLITVPIVMPSGTRTGALTCVLDATESRLDYRAEDVPFVEEVARRAGAAIEIAHSYEREKRIALELQAASLPASLPAVDGLHLSAEYRPGSDEARIGGDWYDAFALEDGRIAITIGDVLGHGLHAAITMTKLRQAMHSAAMVTPDPNVMLSVADKTLRMLDGNAYATALAAIYDAENHVLSFATAGHPGPIRRNVDGSVDEFRGYGSMLGLREGDERRTTELATGDGTTVVFYTDGLIEVTRNGDEGRARLTSALERGDGGLVEHPAHWIVETVLNGASPTDDVAVLVARVVPKRAR